MTIETRIKNVIFVSNYQCSCSQIAVGLCRNKYVDSSINFYGCSLENVNLTEPWAVLAMLEIGIDISQQSYENLANIKPNPFNLIIHLQSSNHNSFLKYSVNKSLIHCWEVRNYPRKSLENYRKIRDFIQVQIDLILPQLL